MNKPKTPSSTPKARAKAPAKAKAPATQARAAKAPKKRLTKAEKLANLNQNGTFKPGHEIGAATRWQPGESGNPDGRSSEVQSAQAEFERILAKVALAEVDVKVGKLPDGKDKVIRMTRMEVMLTKLAEAASQGGNNLVAANTEFMNRLVGKARQPLEHTGLGNVYILDTVDEDVPDPRQQPAK